MNRGIAMRRSNTLTAAAVIAALAAAPIARAAEDRDLSYNAMPSARALGVGAVAQVAIPLGGDRTSAAPGPRLSLRAGPSLARTGARLRPAERSQVAPLAEFAFTPGHSTRLSLAGEPLAVRYTPQALAERRGTLPDGDRQNISTLGWVGIGVAAAAIVGGLLFIDAVRDSSD
jgi:hypothetical protein